jgi:uncharacterized protein
MSGVAGREEEQRILELAYQSNNPEFIALYGRRRIGKTHLVRSHFSHKKEGLFFYVTGMKEGLLAEQIKNVTDEIGETFLYSGARLEVRKNWRETFSVLHDNIKATPNNKKIVMFFDEFPWMVTKNSRLLQVVEYYWNHHWSRDGRIKLIICGSSSGWILKHIINNQGGLYNRVTRAIYLQPFNLHKTKRFLAHLKIKLNHKQIAYLYMVLGGVPYYFSQIAPGLSASQIIERLAFKKDSFLLKEFNSIYATLFDAQEEHIALVEAIVENRCGIGQENLVTKVKNISSGGRVVRWLEDLENAGFIIRFKPYLHRKKGIYYRVIDEYSLFYFDWVAPVKASLLELGMRKGYWENVQTSPAWYSWAGYAFEMLCYKHIPQISVALGLRPSAIPYTWRYVPSKGSNDAGAQIDLLFDRDDDSITLCEIKYTQTPYVIDKNYAQKLQQKIDVFKRVTKTKKHIFLAMISANGVKESIYSEALLDGGVVTLDELFRATE